MSDFNFAEAQWILDGLKQRGVTDARHAAFLLVLAASAALGDNAPNEEEATDNVAALKELLDYITQQRFERTRHDRW